MKTLIIIYRILGITFVVAAILLACAISHAGVHFGQGYLVIPHFINESDAVIWGKKYVGSEQAIMGIINRIRQFKTGQNTIKVTDKDLIEAHIKRFELALDELLKTKGASVTIQSIPIKEE